MATVASRSLVFLKRIAAKIISPGIGDHLEHGRGTSSAGGRRRSDGGGGSLRIPAIAIAQSDGS
jgi:hypothetical protein